ncbi:MAG: histidine phosphatase family protein [Spirochaetaceae bacterium]|jgi:broad specificity phosphatase PhoE|nr:histidine phosphatase family protein [Spirochaetaceae bacterium]
MKIAVVRHGETDWNRLGKMQGQEDIPLNETGKRQAADAADRLSGSLWTAIVSSPLARARQTGEIIARKLGIQTILADPGFTERHLGRISGMLIPEFDRLYPDGQCSEIEPWEPLQERMAQTLLKYAEIFQPRDFIAVSHGWAIKALLALGQADAGVLKNGGITFLEYAAGRFT